ncbi:MAG: AzlC family ABC transporter permease [Chloroflexota bacterium]
MRRHLREDVPALTAAGDREIGTGDGNAALEASRRRLVVEGVGIAVSALGFGFVYGLTARAAGFSAVEAVGMSVIVFAGASQFAAVGYIAQGLAWPAIILLTFFVNARHLLYSAALAPWTSPIPRSRRAVMAHVLTDEAFALSLNHFRRLGRLDERGYWLAAIGATFIPWNLATVAGVLIGGQIADPAVLGIDVVFPAAMAALAVALVTGRRELVAAIAGPSIGVLVGLAAGPGPGIAAGGLGGPLIALVVPVPPEPSATLDTAGYEIGGGRHRLPLDVGPDPR